MAGFEAISTICEAVLELLRSNYDPDRFNRNPAEFRVYLARDFAKPMECGVSLFLYRVVPNGVHRHPAGSLGPGGRRFRNRLPVDIHFLLTAWGRDASLQHRIAGWMMRVMEDLRIFPAAFLNSVTANVFGPDETVEICLAELINEDLLRLWETLTQDQYQLSIPYMARNIRIESDRLMEAAFPEIQSRGVAAGRIE